MQKIFSDRMPATLLVLLYLYLHFPSLMHSSNIKDLTLEQSKNSQGSLLPTGAISRLGSHRFVDDRPVFSRDIAFASDSKTLISFDLDNTIRHWDVQSGKLTRKLVIPGASDIDPANVSIKFSGGGKSLLFDLGVTSEVWNTSSGMLIRKFGGKGGGSTVGKKVRVFAPNESALMATYPASPPELWDLKVNTHVLLSGTVSHEIHCCFSADSKLLAYEVPISPKGFVEIVESPSGKKIGRLDSDYQIGSGFGFSPDGKILAESVQFGPLKLWDVGQQKVIQSFPQGKFFEWGEENKRQVTAVVFSPDGDWLAVAVKLADSLRLWNLKKGTYVDLPVGHGTRINGIAFSPDSRLLGAALERAGIRVWEVPMAQPLKDQSGHFLSVGGITFSADSKKVVTWSEDRTLRWWDSVTGKELKKIDGPSFVHDVASSPYGNMLLIAQPQSLELRSLTEGELIKHLSGPKEKLRGIAICPEGKVALLIPKGLRPEVIDVYTGKRVATLDLPAKAQDSPNTFLTPSFDSSGAMIALRAVDLLSIGCWDGHSGKLLQTLSVSDAPANDEDYCGAETRVLTWRDTLPFQKGVLAASTEKEVLVWYIPTGALIYFLKRDLKNKEHFYSTALSPHLKALAIGKDGSIDLIEMATWRKRGHLKGHLGCVLCLAFSSDGKRLASGGEDTIGLVWDLTSFGQVDTGQITEQKMEALWMDLESTDASSAYRAICTLTRHSNQTLSLVNQRWNQLGFLPQKEIQELIADLDHSTYFKRTKATATLKKVIRIVSPILRGAKKKSTSAEMVNRIDELLRLEWKPITEPNELRSWRVLEILELIGSPEARQLLKKAMG